jgi:hypothetical protein
MASFSGFDAPFRLQSQLYQPPRTPSSSSSAYFSADNNNTSTRKRVRRDGPDERSRGLDQLFSTELASPAPLVNTDYILAGGGARHLDFTEEKDNEVEEELDYRPNRYRDNSLLTRETPDDNHNENARRKRSRSDDAAAEMNIPETPSTPSGTWGRTVFTVVGKVLDFCWSGAFKGFSAGGGRTYQMTATSPPSSSSLNQSSQAWQMIPDKDDIFGPKPQKLSSSPSTPIPGQFPHDEVEQLERRRDRDLRSSWVIVPEAQSSTSFPAPSSSRSGSPTHFARRPARRSGVTYHHRSTIQAAPAAATAARRSTTGKGSATPRLTSKRPTLNPTRPSSTVSSALRPATPTKNPLLSPTRSSPASVEAQRYAAKFRRREREEDASIQKMNDQLRALIREGKEALGTRVEVDDPVDMDLDDSDDD